MSKTFSNRSKLLKQALQETQLRAFIPKQVPVVLYKQEDTYSAKKGYDMVLTSTFHI